MIRVLAELGAFVAAAQRSGLSSVDAFSVMRAYHLGRYGTWQHMLDDIDGHYSEVSSAT